MKLVLLGAGGHCRACIDVAIDAGWQICGYVAPEMSTAASELPYLGTDACLSEAGADRYAYLVAVGQVGVSPLRAKLFSKLRENHLNTATIISARAYVSSRASLGAGSIVLHKALVNYGAVVGENCIINSAALIEHDCLVGSNCHIATGAILNGSVSVGDGSMIGSGTVVLQGISIAHNVMVGAGSVVTGDIPEPGVWVGAPARRIK